MNSELLQVIHDGEAVELIGAEERGADGRGWRNVKTGSGVSGWVVGEYVSADAQTTGVAQAAAPPPPPPTATPTRAGRHAYTAHR